MTHVTHSTGREGPHHDPYHVETWTVKRPNGDNIELRLGSLTGNSCRISREGKVVFAMKDDKFAVPLFERYVGVSLKAIEKAFQDMPWRRMKSHVCGGIQRSPRDFREMSGYPGESFTVCDHCGFHADYHFNRSAIE